MTYFDNTMDCPCLSGETYRNCCEPLHKGKDYAKTAEQLMRSRFSAYAVGREIPDQSANYLVATSLSEETDKPAIIQYMKDTCWVGLVILDTQAGSLNDDTGIVEFCALSIPNSLMNTDAPSNIEQQHERSNFEKRQDRWIYTSGISLSPIKFERNMPCWCGSGKKYKKCHAV